jgi:hypothetical protein
MEIVMGHWFAPMVRKIARHVKEKSRWIVGSAMEAISCQIRFWLIQFVTITIPRLLMTSAPLMENALE